MQIKMHCNQALMQGRAIWFCKMLSDHLWIILIDFASYLYTQNIKYTKYILQTYQNDLISFIK